MTNEQIENLEYWKAQPLITRPFNTAKEARDAADVEMPGWRSSHQVCESPSGWFVTEFYA